MLHFFKGVLVVKAWLYLKACHGNRGQSGPTNHKANRLHSVSIQYWSNSSFPSPAKFTYKEYGKVFQQIGRFVFGKIYLGMDLEAGRIYAASQSSGFDSVKGTTDQYISFF